jgi:acetylornithine/succinyldiaminopimelate/putrescine aminotransferase
MQASAGNWLVGEPDPAFTQVPMGDVGALADAVTDRTAAVIMETIAATSGFEIPELDWYRRVREVCDAAGSLLIIDETQTGLGRTGRLWAFEGWGFIPDVVTVGKGPGGAYYPIAFCTWRVCHDQFFRERPLVHTSSYAGSDLGCVVALAVLDQTTEPGFLEHVRAMGQRMADGLAAIDDRYPGWIREVRGRGLMLGIEGPHPQAGFDLSRACLRRGVLAIAALNRPSTMQLMPPLVIQPDEVDEVLAVLEDSIRELVVQR